MAGGGAIKHQIRENKVTHEHTTKHTAKTDNGDARVASEGFWGVGGGSGVDRRWGRRTRQTDL